MGYNKMNLFDISLNFEGTNLHNYAPWFFFQVIFYIVIILFYKESLNFTDMLFYWKSRDTFSKVLKN